MNDATDGDVATTSAADGESAETAADENSDATYSGLLGAFPYAYRTSESRLFRSYVITGGLLAVLVVALFSLAIVVLLGQTAAATGGTFTFSRAFFLVLMLLVFGPLVAPVLFVARRHRRDGSDTGYDRALATGGYLFVVSIYVGLVISTPEALQDDSSGSVAPVADLLYSLPREAGVIPPMLAAGLIYVLHRRLD